MGALVPVTVTVEADGGGNADHAVGTIEPTADASDTTDDAAMLPVGAPEGWIPLPGVPASCEIVIAPDSSRAHPPPTWGTCGAGCLQFQVPNPDTWSGLKLAVGAARGGTRYIGFQNDLPGSDRVEFEIVRTNDNVVTFDALALSWVHRCAFDLDALTPDNVLLDAYSTVADGGQAHRFFRFVMSPGESIPHLVFDQTTSTVQQRYAVSGALWAASYGANRAMQWHDLTFATAPNIGWQSPDGREMLALQAVGSTILASTALVHRSYSTLLWNPSDGPASLVEYASIDQGGACCTGADGTNMVWLEGAGWQRPDADVIDMFAEVWLMASPSVTRPADLRPRKLRRAFTDFLEGEPIVVGGGYALTTEGRMTDPTNRLVLTRLTDGAFVSISAPSGFLWLSALYVDDTELAAFQKPATGSDYFAKPLSIVRQTIASLGPFQPSDAGL